MADIAQRTTEIAPDGNGSPGRRPLKASGRSLPTGALLYGPARKRPRWDRRARAGFTLVELLCAMTLLVIGAFSVFALIMLSIQVDMESAHYANARAIAQRQMEEIRTKTWDSMPTPGTYTVILGANELPGGSGQYVVSQIYAHTSVPPQTGLDLVTITITWPEPGRGTDSVVLDTYVTENGINTH